MERTCVLLGHDGPGGFVCWCLAYSKNSESIHDRHHRDSYPWQPSHQFQRHFHTTCSTFTIHKHTAHKQSSQNALVSYSICRIHKLGKQFLCNSIPQIPIIYVHPTQTIPARTDPVHFAQDHFCDIPEMGDVISFLPWRASRSFRRHREQKAEAQNLSTTY